MTPHKSCKCQLTVIIRYVNKKGMICERFLGFFDISLEWDVEAITAVVMRALANYNPETGFYMDPEWQKAAWATGRQHNYYYIIIIVLSSCRPRSFLSFWVHIETCFRIVVGKCPHHHSSYGFNISFEANVKETKKPLTYHSLFIYVADNDRQLALAWFMWCHPLPLLWMRLCLFLYLFLPE